MSVLPDDSGNSLVEKLCLPGDAQGPLWGLRYVAKDNIDVAGVPTNNGNPRFNAWRGTPASSAPVISTLQAAGATLMGKAGQHELAYGLTGVNRHYGTPVNPRVPDAIPGGSSSGSAAAVAFGFVDFALGTDTGGSVRLPAGFCGIFGWRPTHGALSADGVVPLGASFDTVGVLAAKSLVLEQVMRTLSAPSTSVPISRVLLLDEVRQWTSPEVMQMWESFAEASGLPITEIAGTDLLDRARLAQGVLQGIEAYGYHREWLESERPKLGEDVAALLQTAADRTPEEAAAAQMERDAVTAEVLELLTPGTVLLLPASPVPPPKLSALDGEGGRSFRVNTLRLTNLASVAGLPVITVPLDTAGGEPVGVQLIGARGSDMELLRHGQDFSAR